MDKITAVKGMSDLLPDEAGRWQRMERQMAGICNAWGYRQIRLPLVERTTLFRRSVGASSDIVGKEMYGVLGGKDELSLRPEGTAGCVRAMIEHGLLGAPLRLWYLGPMFRHENTQKGRRRQFHQFGVEAFGMAGPDIDAEVIALGEAIWDALEPTSRPLLHLNSLGDKKCRERYKEALVDYLRPRYGDLDGDSRRRLDSNPLRILDSKNSGTQDLLRDAPRLTKYLGDDARRHFDRLCELLDQLKIEYSLNERLVRGLDYYNGTVFEWQVGEEGGLGAQNALCAGGRYDGLTRHLGGADSAALGFALGLERLLLLLADSTAKDSADCYLIAQDQRAQGRLMEMAQRLRRQLAKKRIVQDCGGGKLNKAMQRADRNGAALALIIGEDELAEGTVSVKDLRAGRDGGRQQSMKNDDALADKLRALLSGS